MHVESNENRAAQLTRRNLGQLALATGTGVVNSTVASDSAVAAATWRTTGTAVSALNSFDTQMQTFMQARSITAGQLAVTYQGRLVLARGYTYSDDSSLSVQPTSLFRIASLSKSITAAAIMRLVQDGKLSLSRSLQVTSREVDAVLAERGGCRNQGFHALGRQR